MEHKQQDLIHFQGDITVASQFGIRRVLKWDNYRLTNLDFGISGCFGIDTVNWEHSRISGCLLALTQQAIPAPEPRLGPSGLLVENEFEVSCSQSTFKTLYIILNLKP